MKSLIAIGLAVLLSLGSANVASAGALPATTSTYSGIIGLGGGAGDQGKISIAITPTGQYTLRGKIMGIGFTNKGQVSEAGTVSDDFVIKLLGGFVKIPVHLEFAVAQDGKEITGLATFSFQGETATVAFKLYRSAKYTRDSPAPQAGRHVIVFRPNEDEESGTVPGRGVATVNVSPTGKVSVSGVLADGSKVSCGGSVSEDGIFPILNVLYGRTGFVAGFARFNNELSDDVLAWARFTKKGAPIFAGELFVEIHPFAPPVAGTPAINFGTAENAAPFFLSGGGLPNSLQTTLQIDDRNKVSVVGENESKLQLKLNKKTGLISGTIKLEIDDQTRRRAVKVVILQDEQIVEGLFVSPLPSPEAIGGVP